MRPTVAARGLTAGFEGRIVLEGIDLEIARGEFIALVGPNGVGKTTLLRTLGAAARAIAGVVEIDGRNAADYGPAELARKLARVEQSPRADWNYSVEETVALGRFAHRGWFAPLSREDRKAVRNALDRTGLSEFRDRRITELSGGELQRVMIARALAQEPEILLLDEPVSQLDLKHQMAVLEIVRGLADSGITVVASIHDLNLSALFADRIALFSMKRLRAIGAPSEILSEALIREVFEIPVLVGVHPDKAGSPYVYHRPTRKDAHD